MKTAREELIERGLGHIVDNCPDYIRSNYAFILGCIQVYNREIKYLAEHGGPNMRERIIRLTHDTELVFAYIDQLWSEYQTALVEARKALWKGGDDYGDYIK